jgi:hypothetical protein
MHKLPVINFGTDVQGFELYGNPQRQVEPSEVRITFPGGDVTVARTTNNDYWVHVRVNTDTDDTWVAGEAVGHITDARLDSTNRHTSEANVGDFADPNLYHLAVRVTH